jgi:hypothetical protein
MDGEADAPLTFGKSVHFAHSLHLCGCAGCLLLRGFIAVDFTVVSHARIERLHALHHIHLEICFPKKKVTDS